MPNNELVSILMPVYNAENYLEACLGSICKQLYPHWQLIAINDFSTDKSKELLQQFASREKRIQVYDNDSKGIIPALRKAFRFSSGNMITRMDADDIMHPAKLLEMTSLLKSQGKGHLITAYVSYFSENQLGEGYRRYAEWLNELAAKGKNFDEIYRECVIPSPCWLTYRSDLEHAGAFESDIYPEDYELCFRFRSINLKVRAVKKVLHYWRDHSHRTSRISPDYADNSFLDLKLSYFLKEDYNKLERLIVWGAGRKGKYIAKHLSDAGIEFHWITSNQKKLSVQIYGKSLDDASKFEFKTKDQLIWSIAQKNATMHLEKLMVLNDRKALDLDIYRFC